LEPRAGGTRSARSTHGAIPRVARHRGSASRGRVELADSRFLCQLAALALLGEALFGKQGAVAFGDSGDAAASRDFRHRLARLLTELR
jgi:hypothetical protein